MELSKDHLKENIDLLNKDIKNLKDLQDAIDQNKQVSNEDVEIEYNNYLNSRSLVENEKEGIIAELNSQLKLMDGTKDHTIVGLEAEIDTLKSQNTELENEKTDLKNHNSTLQDEIDNFSTLQDEMNKNSIPKDENDNNSIDTSVNTQPVSSDHTFAIKELEKQIDSNENAIKKLDFQIDTNKKAINSKKEQLDNRNEELKVQKSSLNESIELQKENLENKNDQIRTSTLVEIKNSIEEKELQLTALQKELESVHLNEEKTTITASRSGIIEMPNDLHIGESVSSDEILLSISPEGTPNRVLLYVNSKDVNNINEGDKIKYTFNSGEIKTYNGEVTQIFHDPVVDGESGETLFIVEGDLKVETDAELRSGSSGKASIIIEQRNALSIFLEKLDLL